MKPGVVTVYENDGTSKKIFVSSGTITVNEDSSVQVLVEEAHPVESLDLSAAREVLSQSQSELSQAQTDKVNGIDTGGILGIYRTRNTRNIFINI